MRLDSALSLFVTALPTQTFGRASQCHCILVLGKFRVCFEASGWIFFGIAARFGIVAPKTTLNLLSGEAYRPSLLASNARGEYYSND